jgi:hypothetical protein
MSMASIREETESQPTIVAEDSFRLTGGVLESYRRTPAEPRQIREVQVRRAKYGVELRLD